MQESEPSERTTGICPPRSLWIILLIALLARLAAAFVLQYQLDHHWHRSFLIEGDANGYWELAIQLAQGKPYAIYSPPRYALRMPGFPWLLSLSIRAFGPNVLAARCWLAVLGTLNCWLVYVLGTRLQGRKVGLVAAGLAAIHPVFIVFSVMILSETAFAGGLLLSLIAVDGVARKLRMPSTNLRRGPTWALSALLGGLAMALACYLRPSWLLAAPLFGLLLVWQVPPKRQALFSAVLIVAGMLLALLPWGIRNQHVTGHFTLTTFWLGPSLYDALNPHATGDSDMRFFDEDALLNEMSEYEVDRHYRNKAWDFVRSHPGRAVQLAIIKLERFWNPWPNADQFDHPAVAWGVAVCFLGVGLLALWGALLCRNQVWTVAMAATPIFYLSLLHMVFVGSLRYRLPAEYSLLVLSAVGLNGMIAWRGHRRSTG